MPAKSSRWFALALSSAVALAGAWLVLDRFRAQNVSTTVAFRELTPLSELSGERLLSPEAFFRVPEPSERLPGRPEDRRLYLTEQTVAEFFGASDPRAVYDPWTYDWDPGNRDEFFDWPEHPLGRWRLRTNESGLREDTEYPGPRRDVRILATGDSHSAGVCNNDESFANVLEAELARDLADRSVEVLNAARPGFDCFNYLGVLHKFQAFEPQVFVVSVFGGNDLLSGLDMYHRLTREPSPEWTSEQRRRHAELLRHAPNALGQCYYGSAFITSHPEQGDLAVRVCVTLCREMQSVCAARGIHMLLVYIPPPCDLAWPEPVEEIGRGRRIAGLPENAGSGLAVVEEGFLAGLAEHGIEVLDMRPVFRAQERPPYWRKDQHLDLAGHRLIAESLRARVAELVR